MRFRIATLNIEQNHKRWDERGELIVDQWGKLRPDLLALNEVYIPDQSARITRADIGRDLCRLLKHRAGCSCGEPSDFVCDQS